MAPVVGVVNVLFVESRAPAVDGGGVLGDFPFFRVVMALDGLVASAVTGHLQAAYRPRDIAKQRELARTSDQLEQQASSGFRTFVQVSALGCIDLGDRRSEVQILSARQLRTPGISTISGLFEC